MIYFFITIGTPLLIIATLPGTIELFIVSFGAIFNKIGKCFSSYQKPKTSDKRRLAIVIPAHNEEDNIEKTIKSLQQCVDPFNNHMITVIADNCSDNTESIAKNHGVHVLIRKDPQNKGKGQALSWAFDTLLEDGFDLFLVIDADTTVNKNLIIHIREAFSEGADAIQTQYLVKNAQETPRTRLMNLAWTAFNVLRPLGRNFWGLSAGIFGNGFALSKETLKKVPYTASSIVEDLEYHLLLVKNHLHVQFIEKTTVKGLIPTEKKATTSQRSRWEGGRLRLIIEQAPILFFNTLKGNKRCLEPLLDLLLLPLSYHTFLLLILWVISPSIIYPFLIISTAILFLYGFIAITMNIKKLKDLSILLTIPIYCLWKIAILSKILLATKKNHSWTHSRK